ncbi:MAG: DeoR/GlpR transcriptional regulator [Lachnospiraceae bacterium]|nr:DeoR/GlpR transcriptional regulator [Lachnospiraceae bacterium]
MIPNERRESILELLRKKGYMTVKDLSSKLYVSYPTIRRDLAVLEKEGVLKRVHGGVSLVNPESSLEPLDFRSRISKGEKGIIAGIASTLIRDGNTIFLDSGSTCLALAYAMRSIPGLTVLTNGLRNVPVLSQCENIRISLPGGHYDIRHSCLVGEDAASFVAAHHADLCFVSCTGLDAEHGASVIYSDDISVKKAFQRHSTKTILMMDHTKYNKSLFYRVYDYTEFDVLITDTPVPDDIRQKCEAHGVELISE